MEIQITEENPTVCPKVKSDEVLSECEDAYVEGFEALRKGKESDSSLPSPINLNVSDAIKVRLPNLKWHKYDVIPRKMKVTNSGRTGKFLKTFQLAKFAEQTISLALLSLFPSNVRIAFQLF